jgi:hypothetical protein
VDSVGTYGPARLKLYALRRIPWTQAFGTLYLVSYATNAVLKVLAQKRCGWPVDAATSICLSPLFILWLILDIGVSTTDVKILLFPPGAVLFSMNVLVNRFFPPFLKIIADVFGSSVKTMRYNFAGSFTVVSVSVEFCLLGVFLLTMVFFESKVFILNPFDSITHGWATYTPYGFAFF